LKKIAYISPICSEAPRERIYVKFGTELSRGRNHCAKFYVDQASILWGSNFWHSDRNEVSPL